mmetsp:Transcript_4092/g.7511  ORF Transcript_4092/g.7511 Transcript_4092/m.7511 type:complete len:146 (-) Transcript_4092:42-479(-)
MLHGLPSYQTEQTPTCGLFMSSSLSPVAYSMAWEAPCDLGPVKARLYLFKTGPSPSMDMESFVVAEVRNPADVDKGVKNDQVVKGKDVTATVQRLKRNVFILVEVPSMKWKQGWKKADLFGSLCYLAMDKRGLVGPTRFYDYYNI